MPVALNAIIAGAVLVIDQVSKYYFKQIDILLIPGVLKFSGTKNTGMAFGLLSGSHWVLPLLTGLVIILLVVYIIKLKPRGLLSIGISLILGGALGNLIDRLIFSYVIDFIQLLFVRFAVFNIADMAITTGSIMCFFAVLLSKEDLNA